MEKKEQAVLIGITPFGQSEEETKEFLDELEFLALTAGAHCHARFTQKISMPNPKTFLGSGKLAEVVDYCKEHKIDLVIFDDELSPSQLRNLERSFEKEIKILDRNNLILDIFASRAQTAQAKAQVELAQHQYLLPRLTRMWTHLSRQKGGIGMKGPGESEIETDRRIIRNNISLLKKKLEKIDKQNATRRKQRGEKIRVALVGYTNVGKSTLLNLLSNAGILAENKLFATLDTTVRKIVLDRVPFLLSDTVGFIRKLPHDLVESFKSTLDEVREADILLHVVDISHPNYEQHLEVVKQTLADIKTGDQRTILVFNKVDRYLESFEPEFLDETAESRLEHLKSGYLKDGADQAIFISATKKIGIGDLKALLVEEVKLAYEKVYPHLPNPHDYAKDYTE